MPKVIDRIKERRAREQELLREIERNEKKDSMDRDAPVESILEESTKDMIKRSTGGSMSCPHRPDGIRGGGAAIKGMKFIGVK